MSVQNNPPRDPNQGTSIGTASQSPNLANVRHLITHASVASNGANAIVGSIGAGCFRAPGPLRLQSAWWEPNGADSAASNTASYRNINVLNAGQTGTGATVLASLALTASLASNNTRGLTLGARPVLNAGDIVAFQHATVGGAHSDGTVLVAGQLHTNWRAI